MKLSDFVASALAVFTDHVFVVQGGAALHLIDSVHQCDGIVDIPMQHEQACAMAADAYAKAQHSIGATIATSGPGATNLLTGIACSYFDSVPTVHITGNVASFRQSGSIGVRQYGFQETDIVSMASPITKVAYQISSPEDILQALPQAIYTALGGRKGPVLIDIPDDFQRVVLDSRQCANALDNLRAYTPSVSVNALPCADEVQVSEVLAQFNAAQRPVFIFGAGISTPSLQAQFVHIAEKLDVPFLVTWPNKSMAAGHPLNVGTFGTHSSRGNNVVLQNADFVFSVGCRMDSRATGKLDLFAREAVVGMVEIDKAEMDKFDTFGFEVAYKLHCSAQSFADRLIALTESNDAHASLSKAAWHDYISKMQNKYNGQPAYALPLVNPYEAARQMSAHLRENDKICVDTGTCLPLTLVYSQEKAGQQFISSYNNTPMGYGLPAAIGVALQAKARKTFSINGDGGLQMNIQELATVAAHNLNILIILYNNQGHAMIKQTQDDWLDARYIASSSNSGLPKLNFANIAKGYGIEAYQVTSNAVFAQVLEKTLNATHPVLIELMIDEGFRCEPIIKYGNPLEAMSPADLNMSIREDMLVANVES